MHSFDAFRQAGAGSPVDPVPAQPNDISTVRDLSKSWGKGHTCFKLPQEPGLEGIIPLSVVSST